MLDISFVSEDKQLLSCSYARCLGGSMCYSWLDYTSTGAVSAQLESLQAL